MKNLVSQALDRLDCEGAAALKAAHDVDIAIVREALERADKLAHDVRNALTPTVMALDELHDEGEIPAEVIDDARVGIRRAVELLGMTTGGAPATTAGGEGEALGGASSSQPSTTVGGSPWPLKTSPGAGKGPPGLLEEQVAFLRTMGLALAFTEPLLLSEGDRFMDAVTTVLGGDGVVRPCPGFRFVASRT